MSNDELHELLSERLEDPATSWSVGCFGAIAEFHRDPDEPAHRLEPLGLATSRGSVRIRSLASADALAYETTRGHGAPWQHGLDLHMEVSAARMGCREVLTRLEDTDEGALFDLGLGATNIDACVLVCDAALERSIEAGLGRSYFDEGSGVVPLIKEASPTRVFRSKVAEVRVHQPIGSTKRNIPTPVGPHTHVLPGLLKTGLAQAETVPIPKGRVSVLGVHPPHPVRDELGKEKAFDRAEYDAFQALLERWGDREVLEAKRALLGQARGGAAPTRVDRRVARVLIHQLGCLGIPTAEMAAEWGLEHLDLPASTTGAN